MASIFKMFWIRLNIDYREWRDEWLTRWNTRREMKQIDSAIRRGKERNARDHKTYYIIRDRRGGINALTGSEIDLWARRGLFPKMTILQKLQKSIDIVTNSNMMKDLFYDFKINNSKKP